MYLTAREKEGKTMTSREIAHIKLSSPTCQWTIEKAQNTIERHNRSLNYYNSLPDWKKCSFDIQLDISRLEKEIEIMEAIIEILIEQEELIIASEAVQAVATLVKSFAKTTVMRKVVATVSNKLRKLGYSLSDCFKRAWVLVKGTMGFMYGKQTVAV